MYFLSVANTDSVKLALIGGFVALGTIVIQSVQAFAVARINVNQERRARDFGRRADDLTGNMDRFHESVGQFQDKMIDRADVGLRKLEESVTLGKATHLLVNSALLDKLRALMLLLEWKAGVTKDPTDIAEASYGRREYEACLMRQDDLKAVLEVLHEVKPNDVPVGS